MNRILIITGGEIDSISSLGYIEKRKYNKVIAVDGGLLGADILSIRPDVVVGDFDTVSESLLEKYEKAGVKIVRLNPIKDDTDTEEAYRLAVEAGATHIDIIGAVGTRIDHSISNLFILKRAMEQGIKASIITKLCRVSVITGDVVVEKSKMYGKYISLIQFDGSARGVTLKDFVYELEDFDFDTKKTYRLGVSNELEKEYGYIHISEGCMLMIEAKEDKNS